MKDSGNCFLSAGDLMMVDFGEIAKIAFIVYDLGETVVINNIPVDEHTYGAYVTNIYDA